MNIEEELLKLIEKCKNMSFADKIRFLVKAAEETDSKDMRAVLFLYLDYLIQNKNKRGNAPFSLPPLAEIKKISSKLEDKPKLQDILSDIETGRKVRAQDLGMYNKGTSMNEISGPLYERKTGIPEIYKTEYTPGRSGYEAIRKTDYEKARITNYESGLESIAQEENQMDKEKKKQEKEKLLY